MDKIKNNNKDLRWYMVTTISGKEEKVIEGLKNRVISEHLESEFYYESDALDNLKADDFVEAFKAMMVPHLSAKDLEKKNNNEDFKAKKRNLFPGYIFIKMNMTNEAWFMIRNTQYVTGLVGSSGQRAKPTPVSDLEIKRMERRVAKITSDFESGKYISEFIPGTVVEVVDGPAKGQVGAIIENNDERQVAVVELILFERKTPTEIAHKNLKIKE